MTRIVAVIVLAFILIPSTAQARHHHYRHPYYQIAPMTWGHVVQHQSRHHRRHRTARSHHKTIDASGNRAFEIVRTAEGLTAKVAASAKEKFQGFIDAVEADIIPDMGAGYFVDAKVIKGNRISDIGCLSRGHMPGSKHHSGRACDFAQVKRNVTRDKFMYHVSDIAHKFGLTDGCEWGRKRGERYTGPDCGHIEIPGDNGSVRTASARRHRHHRYRYARM